MPLEELNLEGMNIDSASWRGESLRANFGSGYGAKAVVGVASGLHSWSLSSDCLPDDTDYGNLINGLPRFEYYWEFYKRHTTGASDVFIIPFRGKLYHACFAEPEIGPMEVFTSDLFGGGVEIKQRRISGVGYNSDGSVDTTPPTPPTSLAVTGFDSESVTVDMAPGTD